jgi:hypothetical protein
MLFECCVPTVLEEIKSYVAKPLFIKATITPDNILVSKGARNPTL